MTYDVTDDHTDDVEIPRGSQAAPKALSDDEVRPGYVFVVRTMCSWASQDNMLSPKKIISHINNVLGGKVVPREMMGADLPTVRPGLEIAKAAIEKHCHYDINETCYLKTGEIIDLMHRLSGVMPAERRYS